MKQFYRSKSDVIFKRPQICGKQRILNPNKTVEQAVGDLVKAVEAILKNARWAYYRSPINELRKPLLELYIAKRKERNYDRL